MDVSELVLRGIMTSKSNVIIYKKVKEEWCATVYYEGYMIFTTPGYETLDEVAHDVVVLIEAKTNIKFKASDWVVYGKRLSDSEVRQFKGVSHCFGNSQDRQG